MSPLVGDAGAAPVLPGFEAFGNDTGRLVREQENVSAPRCRIRIDNAYQKMGDIALSRAIERGTNARTFITHDMARKTHACEQSLANDGIALRRRPECFDNARLTQSIIREELHHLSGRGFLPRLNESRQRGNFQRGRVRN